MTSETFLLARSDEQRAIDVNQYTKRANTATQGIEKRQAFPLRPIVSHEKYTKTVGIINK